MALLLRHTMNTITQPQLATPKLDATLAQLLTHAELVEAGTLPYLHKVFESKEWPLAHGRKVIAMTMGEEMGGNIERQKFLTLAFGRPKSSDLTHAELSGLWHWLKPWQDGDGHWHANEQAGAAMRGVIRESIEGTWINADGTPTQAAY